MAGSRRGRSKGFPGAELRGTLGTLFRSALGQAGVVRTVIERGAREGRARLDDARLERQRTDALADLGEAVLAAVRRGDLADLEDLPEIAQAVAAVEDLEARLDDTHDDRRRSRDHHPEVITPAHRARFDRSEAPWQRVRDDDRDAADGDVSGADVEPPRRRGGDDGTVSSATWTPPRPAAPQRVWRPGADATGSDAPAADRAPPRAPSEPRSARPESRPGSRAESPRPAPRQESTRPAPRAESPRPEPTTAKTAARKPAPRAGGISFASDDDDGDDLREYMHPDDVPPRPERKPEKKK